MVKSEQDDDILSEVQDNINNIPDEEIKQIVQEKRPLQIIHMSHVQKMINLESKQIHDRWVNRYKSQKVSQTKTRLEQMQERLSMKPIKLIEPPQLARTAQKWNIDSFEKKHHQTDYQIKQYQNWRHKTLSLFPKSRRNFSNQQQLTTSKVQQKDTNKNLSKIDDQQQQIDPFDGLKLYQETQNLSDIVIDQVESAFGIQLVKKSDRQQILREWTKGINKWHEREFDLSLLKVGVPKFFSVQRIQNEMNKIVGHGFNRILKPGEEAQILETINKIIEELNSKPEELLVGVNTIVQKIVQKSNLLYLNKMPMCLKMIEFFWKIAATRFRYSYSSNPTQESNKISETQQEFKQLTQIKEEHNKKKVLNSQFAKIHFINLNKKNDPLVDYLLKYSNWDDIKCQTNQLPSPNGILQKSQF